MPCINTTIKNTVSKIIVLIGAIGLHYQAWGQVVSTPDPNSPCGRLTRHVKITPVDALHKKVTKLSYDNLITNLQGCYPQYTFAPGFTDKEFSLLVPAYFTRSSNEYGDQHFGIAISDGEHSRTILFNYDFDGSYRRDLLQEKSDSTLVNGHTIHRFVNPNGEFVGAIFSSNKLIVYYFTKSQKYEPELEETISKFTW